MAATGRTTCVVVGGGPAGMVLGLLLARAGVEVTVLEKHDDFLRDFRGDTVHTSTLTLLDELGLWPRFDRLPYRALTRARVRFDGGEATLADLTRLDAPHPMIAMVPQWHLLDMLASAAREEPTFTLRMHTEVTDLRRDPDGRVTGVAWRDGAGEVGELAADLVVACDGRDSRVRAASGLPQRRYDVPLDVEWFRVPRHDDDPDGGLGRLGRGRMLVMIDRGDYFQCALIVGKGTDARLRAQGIESLRDLVVGMNPWLAGRLDDFAFDDVRLLEVSLDRLRRWWAPGLLCVGDAAHAMSPVGGVGINLAVQDAVAAARVLAAPLLAGDAPGVARACAAVQRRRTVPTVLTQTAQDLAHRRVVAPVLAAEPVADGEHDELPLPMRVLQRFPVLQWIPARLVGVGALPEHAPAFARRAPLPVSRPS